MSLSAKPLIILLGFLNSSFSDDPDSSKPAPFEPSSHYETRQIQGWTVRVNQDMLKPGDTLAADVFKLLDQQLYLIDRMVPSKAVDKLKKVTIWIERNEPHHPCMAYHPDAGWLREHAMNPEKARCVEIANSKNFLEWTRIQPWMVLHELAHAYHDQALPEGFANPEVARAYQEAIKQGQYQDVLHLDGQMRKAYAETNPMEYFAEGSEAFFDTNDFFPFVKPEFQKHDPELARLLGKLWTLP